ncbi:bifunctional diguanylate cyclase/phosphodiesterase [Pseudoalteromonas sp. GB56]
MLKFIYWPLKSAYRFNGQTHTNTKNNPTRKAQACAAEPIAHIGSIQPHGFQIVADSKTGRIVQYSQNITHFFASHEQAQTPLNTRLDDWIGTFDNNSIASALTQERGVKYVFQGGIISPSQWECFAFMTGPYISLEFTPEGSKLSAECITAYISDLMEDIHHSENFENMMQRVSMRLQNLIGYDRVMVYRFAPEGSGEVIAEAVSQREHPKFLNLRFPKEDIPEQARKLYLKNAVRILSDVDSEPVPLVPNLLPCGEPLDQSNSTIRSLSEMHRIYLRNMGVKATVTLSLITEGKLWGLLVCHHNETRIPPHHIDLDVQTLMVNIAAILNGFLTPRLEVDAVKYYAEQRAEISHVFARLNIDSLSKENFHKLLTMLYQATDYDFIGVGFDNHCHVISEQGYVKLSDKGCKQILSFMSLPKAGETSFHSDALIQQSQTIDGLESMAGINLVFSALRKDIFVFLGRLEIEKSITWAGKPETVNIVVKNGERFLEPRSSFALWRENLSGQSAQWIDKDRKLATHLMRLYHDFVAAKHTEFLVNSLEYKGFHDELTGLANRAYIKTAFAELSLVEPVQFVTLYYIDLDSFKDINDTLGHDFGDRLLIEVTRRLKLIMSDSDTLFRVGGDEFLIVMTSANKQNLKQIYGITQRILEQITLPYTFYEQLISSTACIGVLADSIKHFDINEGLKKIDIALYKAKSQGIGNTHVFDESDQTSYLREITLKNDFEHHVTQGDVLVYFQPQLNEHREVIGLEALARWHHDEFGFINPEYFIDLAERNRLIFELGTKIFDTAIATFAELRSDSPSSSLKSISVNITPTQLIDCRLQPTFEEICKRYGVNHTHVILEITESVFLNDMDKAVTSMANFKKSGFKISLDDFGSGYSSLNYLCNLPIDEVKIDKVFIQDVNDDRSLKVMLEGIIQICKKLNFSVVAEGIETSEHFDLLKNLECEIFQGYLFSKPLPYDVLLIFLNDTDANKQQSMKEDK